MLPSKKIVPRTVSVPLPSHAIRPMMLPLASSALQSYGLFFGTMSIVPTLTSSAVVLFSNGAGGERGRLFLDGRGGGADGAAVLGAERRVGVRSRHVDRRLRQAAGVHVDRG